MGFREDTSSRNCLINSWMGSHLPVLEDQDGEMVGLSPVLTARGTPQ
jgi:hypothetical protein